MAGRIRLLVVDDHEMFAESISRLLALDPGIEVLGVAPSAAAGIERARAERPDVVLMDFQLPDLDGASATARLLAEVPGARVVALTGSDRPGAYYAMREAGCHAWVRKTRAVQDLVTVVRDVAGGTTVADDELAGLPSLDELAVHYQPVLRLDTGTVLGFEALVRWDHPEKGLVYPDAFLPLAEETGFIDAIGARVLDVATLQLASWQGQYPRPEPLFVSVNLSATSLKRDRIVEEVSAAIARAGLAPGDVVLEITEMVLLDDTPETAARLEALHETGVRLALDDFGTAFSSLAYLRRFPFDIVKIDTSFTAELPESPRCRMLVEAIHQLAESVGLAGIAEGIERPEQQRALVDAGWHLGQGFLFSRARPPDACAALLAHPASS